MMWSSFGVMGVSGMSLRVRARLRGEIRARDRATDP
jgi:hypothetical protein